MAIDHRVGSKVIKSLRKEDAAATRVDPHPYIGIVKNNLDPARSGRLQVWIPDLGGSEDDAHNWRTISYASPFMGTTDIAKKANKLPNTDNKFRNVPHTYGMWMVPPDVGVEVIVLFIGGDPLRGYFIACVNSHVSRYMMPGLASSNAVDISGADDATKQSYKLGLLAPVAEYNENNVEVTKNPNFVDNPKPIHEPQYTILKQQGLDRDQSRGTITSSSQRESPSNVFGISTPGRPYDGDPADNPEIYLAKVKAGTLTEDDYRYSTRKGGHTFVMDDGSVTGDDQLVRLRTATGHQIMMNDSDNTLYISHSDGTSWVELASDGQVHIYSKAGFNVRSEGTVNIHSDTNINLNADNNININAGNKLEINAAGINLLSTGKLSVGASGIEFKSGGAYNIDAATVSVQAGGKLVLNGEVLQNTIGGAPVTAPAPIKPNSLTDVALSSTGLYTQSAKLSTIVSVAPTHEPFNRGGRATEETAPISTPPGTPDTSFTPSYKSLKGVSGTLTDTNIRDQLINADGLGVIGPLSKDEVIALLAQIAKSESSGATPMSIDCKVPRSYSPRLQNGQAGYMAINQCGFLGKYQMGYAALQTAGFVGHNCKGTATLGNDAMWLGGLSRDKFLSTPAIQEQAIFNFTKSNYNILVSKKAITTETSHEEIGGLLMTAHMLGAGGANTFARTGVGSDINNGTSGASYFQKGKYAIAVMAPKVAGLRAG
jgi:hypothetical protein